MRKHIFIILLIIYYAPCYGQKENKYSIGVDANYLNYIDYNVKGDFNYGFNFLLSQEIAKVKVGIGIGYSTFNAHWTPDVVDSYSDYLYKEEYKAQYLDFPILFFFNNRLDKKYNFSPFVGMIMNKMIDYERIRNFTDKPQVYVKGIEATKNLGITIRLGANISKLITRDLVISTALFADIKVVSNKFTIDGRFEQPEGRLTFGLKIGMDYRL